MCHSWGLVGKAAMAKPRAISPSLPSFVHCFPPSQAYAFTVPQGNTVVACPFWPESENYPCFISGGYLLTGAAKMQGGTQLAILSDAGEQ